MQLSASPPSAIRRGPRRLVAAGAARLGRTAAVLLAAILLATGAQAREVKVRVGGYTFPPFVDLEHPDGGLLPVMLEALNTLDSAYDFQFVPTSPNRRYAAFARGRFDVIFMEMRDWGWETRNIEVEAIRPLLKGGEVYVARAEAARDQSYFDDLKTKRLAGYIGYHYGFAGFNNDPAYLRKHFDIRLNTSHRGNIEELLAGRVDIAVVPQSFLDLYLKGNPEVRDRLTVGRKLDQAYRLGALVRPDGPIDRETLAGLIERLVDSGRMKEMLDRFDLADQWIF